MLRYLNRIGVFKTNQVNPVDQSNLGPAASQIDPNRRDRPRSETANQKHHLLRRRDESASDCPEPKRIKFRVSDSPAPTPRTLKLKSSDGKIFEVDGEALVESSDKVKLAIESGWWCPGDVIGVPEVDGRTLEVAIEYSEKRAAGAGEEELKDWARALFSADQSTFFDVTLAAYHLKMKSLLDLTCQTVTDTIRGKTPLEVNKILNIQG